MRVRLAVVFRKSAANDDFFIGHVRRVAGDRVLLHHDGGNEIIRARAKVDGRVHRAVRIQPRDAAAVTPLNCVNSPPTTMRLADCIVRQNTVSFAPNPGLNEASSVPSGSTGALRHQIEG